MSRKPLALLTSFTIIALLVLLYTWRLAPRESFHIEKLGIFSYSGRRFEKLRLWYDKYDRCYVILEVPVNSTTINLAFVVHGGGFVAGKATGSSSMARYFLSRGYAVASIEYRLCTETGWLNVTGDIARGARSALSYLESRGLRVGTKVYIGASAGAVAGAILVYAPPTQGHDISGLVDGYIGLSGGYCVSKTPPWRHAEGKSFCGTKVDEIMPFDRRTAPPPRKVPALLIGGGSDRLLDGGGGVNTQAVCMASYLERHGVPVEVVTVRGGHSAPMALLGEGDPRVTGALDKFLEEIGG